MLKNILIITNTCIIVVRRLVHASMCVLLVLCALVGLVYHLCGGEAIAEDDEAVILRYFMMHRQRKNEQNSELVLTEQIH